MRLNDILTKAGKLLPYIGLFFGLQNFAMAKEAKKARLEVASTLHKKLLEELQSRQDIIIANQTSQNKIAGLSADAADHLDSVSTHSHIISELAKKLANPDLDPQEREYILGLLNHNTDQFSTSLENANTTLQQIIDSICSNSNNLISPLNSLSSLIEKYRDFLSSLAVEQFCPLINLLGLIVIFSCLISISAIVYSDYFIKYLNIEAKYPRIAKFIQLRRKFQKYYFNFNFLLILVTLIILF